MMVGYETFRAQMPFHITNLFGEMQGGKTIYCVLFFCEHTIYGFCAFFVQKVKISSDGELRVKN